MRLLLNFILAITSTLILQAQTDDHQILSQPESFRSPSLYAMPQIEDDAQISEHNWLAIIPTHKLSSHKSPGVINPYTELKFKEVYYIIDQDGEYVQLAKAERNQVDESKLRAAQAYGWVKADQLVLWSTALRAANGRSYVKAIPRPDGSGFRFLKTLKLWSKPKQSPKYLLEYGENLQDFYYVLKKERGFFLLTRHPEINSLTAEENILGWIHESDVQLWEDDGVIIHDPAVAKIENLFTPDDMLQGDSSDLSNVEYGNVYINKTGPSNYQMYMSYGALELFRDSLHLEQMLAFSRKRLLSDVEIDDIRVNLQKIDFRGLSKKELNERREVISEHFGASRVPWQQNICLLLVETSGLSPYAFAGKIPSLSLEQLIEQPNSPEALDYYRALDELIDRLSYSMLEKGPTIGSKFINWYYIPTK